MSETHPEGPDLSVMRLRKKGRGSLGACRDVPEEIVAEKEEINLPHLLLLLLLHVLLLSFISPCCCKKASATVVTLSTMDIQPLMTIAVPISSFKLLLLRHVGAAGPLLSPRVGIAGCGLAR